MTARELIAKLNDMPPDAEVLHLWDGEPHTVIEVVWLSRDGEVITAGDNEVAYSTGARPVDAPTEQEDPYWKAHVSA